MNGITAFKTTFTIVFLVNLSGCTEEVDYRQIETINGLLYKIKGQQPFTGKITNQPATPFGIASEGTCEVSISKGLINGAVVCKDNSSRSLLETTFVNGLKDGSETRYSPKNGKISFLQTWSHGQRQGTTKEFNADNGQLILEADYVADKVSGKLKLWDASGSPVTDLVMKNDQPFSGFDKRPGRERHYENGVLHGRQVDYSKNGNSDSYYISSEKFYQHGTPDGRWIEYDEKGRETKVTLYKDGVLLSEDEKRWNGDRLKYRARTIQTNPNATKDNYYRTLKKEEQISAITELPRTKALNLILGYELDQACVDQKVETFFKTNGDETILSSKDLDSFEGKCSKKIKDPF